MLPALILVAGDVSCCRGGIGSVRRQEGREATLVFGGAPPLWWWADRSADPTLHCTPLPDPAAECCTHTCPHTFERKKHI